MFISCVGLYCTRPEQLDIYHTHKWYEYINHPHKSPRSKYHISDILHLSSHLIAQGIYIGTTRPYPIRVLSLRNKTIPSRFRLPIHSSAPTQPLRLPYSTARIISSPLLSSSPFLSIPQIQPASHTSYIPRHTPSPYPESKSPNPKSPTPSIPKHLNPLHLVPSPPSYLVSGNPTIL